MATRKPKAFFVPMDVLEATARIIGAHSAAAKALLNMSARIHAGENAICIEVKGSLVVGDRAMIEKDFDLDDPDGTK
jgi:hypothetical protein